MPTGIYIRTSEIKEKMRLSHAVGHVSSYKKKREIYTQTGMPRAISTAMRGWTKWEGARNGYSSVATKEWYCQACREQQVIGLPSYLIKIRDDDFGRICSLCFNEAIVRKIDNIYALTSFLERVSFVDNST